MTFNYLLLLALLLLPQSQAPPPPPPPPPPADTTIPTFIRCQPQLLLLLPCLPFVQNFVPIPADQCCDDLHDVYDQHPECLCLLADGRHNPFFPVINLTLAAQLPHLCDVSTADDLPSSCTSEHDLGPSSSLPAMPAPMPAPLIIASSLPPPTPPKTGGFFLGVASGAKKRVVEIELPALLFLAIFTLVANGVLVQDISY